MYKKITIKGKSQQTVKSQKSDLRNDTRNKIYSTRKIVLYTGANSVLDSRSNANHVVLNKN